MSHFSGMFGYTGGGMSDNYASKQASSASSAAQAANRSVRDLEDRIERLSLVCMAMWSLIQDKTNLTEQELMARVQQIDLMDGEDDGKASRTVSKCHKCGRAMSPRHRACIYCGAARVQKSAFDGV